MIMPKVFTSWSGGKDGCYACYLAMKEGMEVRYLLNMMDEKGEWSWFHRFPPEVLKQQAAAMNIALLDNPSTLDTYEDDFTRAVAVMKKDGVEGGVFGDIETDHHRKWVEDICARSDITPCLPLWHMSQDDIMDDFIGQGFVAVITACNRDYFGEEWLGRKLDGDFLADIREMQKTTDVTTCGEMGEFHTLVVDGPIFNRRIEIQETANRFNNGYWFLEIRKSELKDK
jgi:diphthine-ammonia ligase